jgi:multidrug efflux pump subunit AcrB
MTMMALSLCIGLLIDDAIVVRENIVRHVHLGKDHVTAAREGTDEIGLAVMATTFAICAVFVPVAFMKGIVGKFFFPFGITVTVAVLGVAVRELHARPDAVVDLEGSAAQPAGRAAGAGHLMRATDRVLDLMHALYERSSTGCSRAAYRCSCRRSRLYGRPFDARRPRDPQPRRWRLATLTHRGVVLLAGIGSFVGAILLTPLVGTSSSPRPTTATSRST